MRLTDYSNESEPFSTEIVLVDIRNFSSLSAREQRSTVIEINKALKTHLHMATSFSSDTFEEIVAGLIPTGDGFYVVIQPKPELDGYGPILALSVRSFILATIELKKLINFRIKISIHRGEIAPFWDVNRRLNFVGPVMNNCARLLNAETSQTTNSFKPDNNFIIASKEAVECFKEKYNYNDDDSYFKKMGVRISDFIEVIDKHGNRHEGAFIEGGKVYFYNPPGFIFQRKSATDEKDT